MAAGKYNFTIEQGSTFTRTLTWKDNLGAPINLTGYAAKLSIYDDKGIVIFEIANGTGITLGGALGTIALSITAAQTFALKFITARYVLQMTVGATETHLLRGMVSLERGDA